MAEKNQDQQSAGAPKPEPEAAAPATKGAPAIVRGIVQRTLAPRHMVVDAVTKQHVGPGGKVNVPSDFVDAHPECFVEE